VSVARTEGRRPALLPRCTLLRPGRLEYQRALELQQSVVAEVRSGADPTLILLEHPHVYTLGARGKEQHVLLSREALRLRGADVVETDRGGDVTYHGPGQVVGYPILDLRRYGQGPVWYVRSLEAVLIETLARFGIVAARSSGRPGVWVGDAKIGAAKIGAIGVRISRGVTTHGFALNVNTDLTYFDHIVPCGLSGVAVTSMERLTSRSFSMHDVEDEVASAFAAQFGVEFAPAEAAGVLLGS